MQRHQFFMFTDRLGKRDLTLSDERGMTLVEVIAVVVLLALLYVVVGKNVFGQSNAAKAKLNDVKMNNVKNILQQYKLEMCIRDRSSGNGRARARAGRVFRTWLTL